jgi:RND family efflux transporter MFP subunit
MKFQNWLGRMAGVAICGIAITGCEKEQNKLVLRPPEVTVAEPVEQEVIEALEFTGTTQGVETVEIRARVKGFLDQMLFQPSGRVTKNQLLFVIDPRQYQAAVDQAKADLSAKKAELEFSSFEVKRLEGLSKQDVAAQYELVQAVSRRDTNIAAIAAAEAALKNAELNLEYTQVKSPIDGRISRNLVDVGNLVGEAGNTELATVVKDIPIYAYFNVSERDYLTLKRKFGVKRDVLDANPTTRRIAPAYLGLFDEKGYPHKGYVDYSDPTVDSATGTLQARAVFDNTDGFLIPGLFVRIQVPISKHPGLLVPDIALGADQSGRYLLVVNDKNVVEYRPVKIGTLVGTMRVISEGISKTDHVIVNGIQRARPGATVTPLALTAASTQPTVPTTTQASK